MLESTYLSVCMVLPGWDGRQLVHEANLFRFSQHSPFSSLQFFVVPISPRQLRSPPLSLHVRLNTAASTYCRQKLHHIFCNFQSCFRPRTFNSEPLRNSRNIHTSVYKALSIQLPPSSRPRSLCSLFKVRWLTKTVGSSKQGNLPCCLPVEELT